MAERKNDSRQRQLLSMGLTTDRAAELAATRAVSAEASLVAEGAALAGLDVHVSAVRSSADESPMLVEAYRLVAPRSGIVAEQRVVRGEYVRAGETVFAVADPTMLWALVDAPESDSIYVRAGAAVGMTVDAFPGMVWRGVVASIDPEVGSHTRTVRARVAVPNLDGALRPGLFLRARIDLSLPSGDENVLVPSSALAPSVGGRGEGVVFVATGSEHFQVRQVETTRRTGDLADVGVEHLLLDLFEAAQCNIR